MYLKRAKSTDLAWLQHPWFAGALTIAAPLFAVSIGLMLLDALRLDASSKVYRASSHALVAKAVTQVLDRDLATERIQELLTRLPDPSPGADDKQKDARKSARSGLLKTVAGRLNADRARLAEDVTALAMGASRPEHLAVLAGGSAAAASMAARVTSSEVIARTQKWVATTLDPYSRDLCVDAIGGKDTAVAINAVGQAVGRSISSERLLATVSETVTTGHDPFNPKIDDSAWAQDLGARLAWGAVALVFSMTFAMVVFASIGQILRIAHPGRWWFLALSFAAAAVAGWFVSSSYSPISGPTPLHKALEAYVELHEVDMLKWGTFFNRLRIVGIALLVAGSVATFLVKMTDADELQEQLRGFKALFNSGSVFLLAAVLEVYALLRWPVLLAGTDAVQAPLQTAAATMAGATGALATVVLMSVYIATTQVLRHQAKASGITVKTIDELLSKFGFGDLASEQTLRIAQALLPLAPGFINVLK